MDFKEFCAKINIFEFHLCMNFLQSPCICADEIYQFSGCELHGLLLVSKARTQSSAVLRTGLPGRMLLRVSLAGAGPSACSRVHVAGIIPSHVSPTGTASATCLLSWAALKSTTLRPGLSLKDYAHPASWKHKSYEYKLIFYLSIKQ